MSKNDDLPRTSEGKVRLYPLPDATVPGVPDVIQDVSATEAQRLLRFQPPAFTTTKPRAAAGMPPGSEVTEGDEGPVFTPPAEPVGSTDQEA
jgi:hypothetical protein